MPKQVLPDKLALLLHSLHMHSAQERIREAVGAIQGWLAPSTIPGEAVVRQAIVLRLLDAAGFDIWNPAEVTPEDPNPAGKRADLMIQSGHGRFALELKGMNVNLQPVDYQQAVAYAAHKSTRWAMLTNGKLWIVLDRMHNPGGTFQDHEVLKLELGQEGHTFADDLAALLDVETWRADAFANAVQSIKGKQQQRLDEARIRREKTAVVEEVMAQFKIPTFDLAVAAAVEMNKLTEVERDVLLGKISDLISDNSILLTYSALDCKADVRYIQKKGEKGIWRMQKGSQCSTRVKDEPSWKNFNKRREDWVKDGTLIRISGSQYELTRECDFDTPSDAACMVCVRSISGWDAWKDDQGRSAQHYRPAKN